MWGQKIFCPYRQGVFVCGEIVRVWDRNFSVRKCGAFSVIPLGLPYPLHAFAGVVLDAFAELSTVVLEVSQIVEVHFKAREW